MKKNGVSINYEQESPVLLFVGDTDRNIFQDSKFYNYKNIIIECTFFDIKDIQSSSDRKHMHWTYLSKIISENKSIIFHIIHISPKNLKSYSDLIDNEYENVQFLY